MKKIRYYLINRIYRILLLSFFSMAIFSLIFINIVYIDVTVEAKATIETGRHFNVKPQVSGIIKEVKVKEGARVSKGETLLYIEEQEKEVDINKVESQLLSLEMNRSQIKKELQLTLLDITNKIAIAKATLDASQARLSKLKKGPVPEEIEVAQELVKKAGIQLKKTREEYADKQEAYKLNLVSLKEVKDIKHQIEEAVSEYEVAQKRLSLLENKYTKEDIEIAEAEVKEAEIRLKVAKSRDKEIEILRNKIGDIDKQIEATKAELILLSDRLKKTEVSSPINGIVLTNSPEQLIGKFVTKGETVLKIGDDSTFVAKARVKEQDIPFVKVGQEAKLFVKPFPHGEYKIFKGSVIEIAAEPETKKEQSLKAMIKPEKSETKDYVTTIIINDPYIQEYGKEFRLRPGFSATAKITVDKDKIIKVILKKLKRVRGKITPTNLHL